jgi:predicted transcriptional regulator
MIREHFVYPWDEMHTVFLPKCNGTIKMLPLVPGEEAKDLERLEYTYGIKIDAELLAKLPKLSEADCKSRQKCLLCQAELLYPTGVPKPYEEIKWFYTTKDGLLEGFRRHGIFVLVPFHRKTDLKALFLLLSLERNMSAEPLWLMEALGLSAARVSGILKMLKEWGLVKDCIGDGVKGRARGRQRFFFVSEKAREVLDRDLQNHVFFRNWVLDVVGLVAKRHPATQWRKDLFEVS